jgi:glycosyltransferase involved in cell wall biosynthesis
MNSIGVMHLIDTLDVGGAELMAVNIANCLPIDRFRPFICTTRRSGPLADKIASHVTHLNLARRHRFDLSAVKRLVRFLAENNIRLLHAHGPAIFLAKVAAMCLPDRTLIWHAHYGGLISRHGRASLLRRAVARATVITVNEELAVWARANLRMPVDRIHYLPNFAIESDPSEPARDLPGSPGFRIVSVANVRPEKDYETLIRAFATLSARLPKAQLLLVGAASDHSYARKIADLVAQLRLNECVSFMGPRDDVHAILKACDVAVLSSNAEGLPMALLEYGTAGLATVATKVGQCPKVLDDGRAGVLVSPSSPDELAHALEDLISSQEKRHSLGQAFQTYVRREFGAEKAIAQLCEIYENSLNPATLQNSRGRDRKNAVSEANVLSAKPSRAFVGHVSTGKD